MIEFVTLAEQELETAGVALDAPQASDRSLSPDLVQRLKEALGEDGSPFTMGVHVDYRSTPAIRHYASRPDLEAIAGCGTVTPDHVIRIKPWPVVIDEIADTAAIAEALHKYRQRYIAYFERAA